MYSLTVTTNFCNSLRNRLNEYKNHVGLTYFKEYVTETVEGNKFIKVFSVEIDHDGKPNRKHIVAFVDKKTGDIFKPASYKAPAKHARGNVNSDQHGMEAINKSGFVNYLK